MNEYEELLKSLVEVTDRLKEYKNAFRAGQYDNATTCARVDMGHVIRDLERGIGFLDKSFRPLIEQDSRWAEDVEAGAIG